MGIKPKKISVRPGNNLEGNGIIIWVYHRKVQVQMRFDHFPELIEEQIDEAVRAWEHSMGKL